MRFPRATRARRTAHAVWAAGAVVALALGAPPVVDAQSPPPPPSPAPGHRVLVVGDSVLEGTYDHIPAALPGWDVTVDAHVNRSTEAGLDVIRAHGTAYDAVVVQLGTNDAGTASIYRPRVQAVMDALAPVPRVLWVTIHEARPYYAEANQIVRDLAATHGNVEIVDWNAAQKPGDTHSDGLHLTEQGATDMAALIAAALQGPPDPVSTTTTSTTTVPPTSAAGAAGPLPGGRISVRHDGGSGDGFPVVLVVVVAAVTILGAGIPLGVARRRRRADSTA